MSLVPRACDDGWPSSGEIGAYLARLLGTAAFQSSDRRRRLLAYIVEQTLAGQDDRLKAYNLALSVLGRDEHFDPTSDPTVRIEVGRLRRDLAHYYLTAGRDDPIRISIPKGRYVAWFETQEQDHGHDKAVAPAAHPVGQMSWPPVWVRRPTAAVAVPLVLLVVLGATWWAWRLRPDVQDAGPAVIVLPLEAVAGGEDGRLLANGLTADLIADLARFDGVRVFAGRIGIGGRVEVPPAAGDLVYIVAGTVAREAGRIHVTARLTEPASEQILWSRSYDRTLSAGDIFGTEGVLTAAIVRELAQSYGVIAADAAKRLDRSQPTTMFAYECVQRAFAFRRSFASEGYAPVRACLEESVARDPGYAAAWAMLAFVHLDAARFGMVPAEDQPAELQAGLGAARHAVELAPDSVTALQSLAALRYATGEIEEAERVLRRAIALNPNDPESLAQLGWRLAVHGRWGEGRDLLQEAIDRTVSVPDWYYLVLAVSLYLANDLEPARAAAEHGKSTCCGLGHVFLAMTEAALGHSEAARAALDEALRQAPLLGRDPTRYWANFQVAPEVVARFNAGLAKAGFRLPP